MNIFQNPMTPPQDDQRQYILEALQEETYLTEGQRAQLRELVLSTEKQMVLDTVEDLLQRLLIQRTENSILIIRKIHNALRLEERTVRQAKEQRELGEVTESMEKLLQHLPS